MDSAPDTLAGGFPHSEIFGSKDAPASPKLIAGCHVFHRLVSPRHSPGALIALENPHARASLFSKRPAIRFSLVSSVKRHSRRTRIRSSGPDADAAVKIQSPQFPPGRVGQAKTRWNSLRRRRAERADVEVKTHVTYSRCQRADEPGSHWTRYLCTW